MNKEPKNDVFRPHLYNVQIKASKAEVTVLSASIKNRHDQVQNYKMMTLAYRSIPGPELSLTL